MEHPFLNIATFFDSEESRSISRLSVLYNDTETLEKAIESLVEGRLDKGLIKERSVLLKPNWVLHSIHEQDGICLRTNEGFILAVVKVILRMGPSRILIGDAPIQGCKWDRMLPEPFLKDLRELSDTSHIPVETRDFRRRRYSFADNRVETGVRPLSDYVIFNVGEESLLETVTTPGRSRFRVTDYDPDRMSSAHSPGVHKYCIAREYFDADVVISLPKIKTHQKTGITGALKNLVGINGDKDFLPHHRIGGTGRGGDCYPGHSSLRYWSELLLDRANRRQGRRDFWYWQKFSALLWKLSMPGPVHQVAAGWYGNDTTWRMVMDLNRIAEYGDADGALHDRPRRHLFSLCDGIIGGQGDGPLEPDPLPLGILSFTNDSLLNDRAMALLMGLPVEKIPLLNPPAKDQGPARVMNLDGKNIEMEDLKYLAVKAIPPKGWLKYFKQ